MDALLMCGGHGRRFDASIEKPLFEVGGRPMVDRVRDALARSRVDTTYAVVSPNAPATRRHLDDLPIVETPGEGYVPDLNRALQRVESPVVTVAADLPLLAGDAVDTLLDVHQSGSLTVCVPAALKRRLGVSLEETVPSGGRELVPTGFNVVADGDETVEVTDDVRLAVNVNRLADVRVAEGLL